MRDMVKTQAMLSFSVWEIAQAMARPAPFWTLAQARASQRIWAGKIRQRGKRLKPWLAATLRLRRQSLRVPESAAKDQALRLLWLPIARRTRRRHKALAKASAMLRRLRLDAIGSIG